MRKRIFVRIQIISLMLFFVCFLLGADGKSGCGSSTNTGSEGGSSNTDTSVVTTTNGTNADSALTASIPNIPTNMGYLVVQTTGGVAKQNISHKTLLTSISGINSALASGNESAYSTAQLFGFAAVPRVNTSSQLIIEPAKNTLLSFLELPSTYASTGPTLDLVAFKLGCGNNTLLPAQITQYLSSFPGSDASLRPLIYDHILAYFNRIIKDNQASPDNTDLIFDTVCLFLKLYHDLKDIPDMYKSSGHAGATLVTPAPGKPPLVYLHRM